MRERGSEELNGKKKKPSQQHPWVCPEELCESKLCPSRCQQWKQTELLLPQCPTCPSGAKSSHRLDDLAPEDLHSGGGDDGQGLQGAAVVLTCVIQAQCDERFAGTLGAVCPDLVH